MSTPARRPLASRETSWARSASAFLARKRVQPNTISVWSVVFSAVGGACFLLSAEHTSWWALGAALGIQLRLICNLMDGMVAIEGGMKSKTGDVFNDLPDRFADLLLIVPAGYAVAWVHGPALGWAAGALAVFTAYVRVLGGALGLKQDFVGPMAKQQRMALLTIAALVTIFEPQPRYVLTAALGLIAIGSLLTVFRRTSRIMQLLRERV
jgi:phosphatidylglycerophosphate synthase